VTASRKLLRSLLWQRLDGPGLEHFRLWDTPDGPLLEGTVFAVNDGEPLRVDYDIICAPTWETRVARMSVSSSGITRRLELVADENHRWWRYGVELAELAGCVDIDLSVTPATNTLPIRRVSLGAGGERDVTAAWVRFPELVVHPLPQRYARTGDREYRYESAGGGGGGAFKAVIEVDELGVVVRYPPGWERVAVDGATRK
jgi:hypothetical protein